MLLLATVPACDRHADGKTAAAETHVLPLGKDTLDLGSDVTVRDVTLKAAAGRGSVDPDTVRARQGDVVRFIAGDGRGQAVSFTDSALSPDARAFLDRTGQLRGPPLVSAGASWVVSLKGAPAGVYPFHSLTQDVGGILIVQAPTAPR